MFGMGWTGLFGNLDGDKEVAKTDPDAEKKRLAMAEAEKEGKAMCEYCKEDIYKTDKSPGGGWTWESELLVGFCDKAGSGHKHKPMLKYNPETGSYYHAE